MTPLPAFSQWVMCVAVWFMGLLAFIIECNISPVCGGAYAWPAVQLLPCARVVAGRPAAADVGQLDDVDPCTGGP